MTTFYFVRHAQSDPAVRDDRARPLTAKGKTDAALVTRFFADKTLDAVLSSPYRRAMDTVRGVAESKNLSVILVEDFRERRVDSVWIDDFDAFTQAQWADFNYRLTDGESLAAVQRRNLAALKQALRAYPDKAVAVGSHGTALSCLVNAFDPSFGWEDFERIRGLMPWMVRFDFAGDRCEALWEYDFFTGKTYARAVDGRKIP